MSYLVLRLVSYLGTGLMVDMNSSMMRNLYIMISYLSSSLVR